MTTRPPDPTRVLTPGPWTHRAVSANGLEFHVALVQATGREGSDQAAPLVLLLHGFATNWWLWHEVMGPLAGRGFTVAAVDLRGYGNSDRPPRGYDQWTAADDVSGIIKALGYSRAHLVGHGSGGFIGWTTTLAHASLVTSLITIAAPHPLALRRSLRQAPQRELFTRFLLAQLPRVAEANLTRNDAATVRTLLTGHSSPAWGETAAAREAAARFAGDIAIPGTAHLALEYHRWLFRSQFRIDGLRYRRALGRPVSCPVTLLYGGDDRTVSAETVRAGARWAPQAVTAEIPGAGHYPPLERPEATDALIAESCARAV